jgi:hypothetical protein
LEDPDYRPLFREFLGMDVGEFLETSKMRRARTYGSEVEIIALSTLLKTPIAVYFQPSLSSTAQWYMYHPIMQLQPTATNHGRPTSPVIYLINPGEHFNRVLSVLSK